MPEDFACRRCGNCCRVEGYVTLSDAELDAAAVFLGLSTDDFIARFTRLKHTRNGLSLIEGEDGACIFLTPDGCRIQPVKPQQCRDFPFTWTTPSLRKICPAL